MTSPNLKHRKLSSLIQFFHNSYIIQFRYDPVMSVNLPQGGDLRKIWNFTVYLISQASKCLDRENASTFSEFHGLEPPLQICSFINSLQKTTLLIKKT